MSETVKEVVLLVSFWSSLFQISFAHYMPNVYTNTDINI